VQSEGSLVGSRGTAWLAFVPQEQSTIDLTGQWEPSVDAINYTAPIALPGEWNTFTARRKVDVPASFKGKNVVLTVDAPGTRMLGVFVNGHWIRRHHHAIGNRWNLNISPWIRFGASNDIELGALDGVNRGRVDAVSLNFYDPGVYP